MISTLLVRLGRVAPLQVTSDSYFADPWLFNCRNDAAQGAIWTAERRATNDAMHQGVVVVAADGKQADDLADPTQDSTSPDDTSPVLRDISNACAVVPTEVAGVIGVTATSPASCAAVTLIQTHANSRNNGGTYWFASAPAIRSVPTSHGG